MGLDATVRAGVATAKTVLADLLITVTHEPFSDHDVNGTPTYGTAVEYQAFVERKGVVLRWRVGLELIDGDMVTFLENVDVQQNDRLTLPGGQTPPIFEIAAPRDPDGGVYYCQVTCGRPERGVTAL